MADLWMKSKTKGQRGIEMEQDAGVCGERKSIERVASSLTGIVSRLVAPYRMPSVHPLASLTPVSDVVVTAGGE
jgi:hypothetical protein